MDATAETAEETGVTVRIDSPAESRSLRLLRLAAADAAAGVGLDLDRVETARLVVDELASLLISASPSTARLQTCITRAERAVELEGSVPIFEGGNVPTPDRIVTELLDVSVGPHAWSVEVDAGEARFRATIGPVRPG